MTVTPESLAAQRLAELITLNEIGLVVSSTLDRDELLDRSLQAVTRHLRFDRALILLVDPVRNVLAGGRSTGGSPEMAGRIAVAEVHLDEEDALLSRIARADGPLLFRDVDTDPDEGNREFARLLEVSSFLGTPLVTKGRTVGVLAVDNRLTGRDVLPGDGPLLYTVGSLIAGGLENARLYAEVEEQKAILEQRVLERTADLVEARQAAEAATEAKSRFLSNVSHELRTPLTSVVGFSKLISKRLAEVVYPAIRPIDDPRVERAMRQVTENLGIIVEEGERLTTLINETLDLAKIEAGRVEWRSETVDIGDVVGRATAATASLLRPDSGPKLVVELETDLPAITGDRDRLIQVVINLISNAVKFTPEGSITIVGWHEVEGGWVQVAVSDTGAGISETDQERVFEPFAQATDGRADHPHGTGLGLPICREIIEHHGGRLWLQSRLGAGSTFQFTLPI
jgi:signal transduction histidine kinase